MPIKLLLFFISTLLLSKDLNLYPFLSYAAYNGYKNHEISTGIYANRTFNKHILYGGLEYKNISYKTNSSKNQFDFTFGDDFNLKKHIYLYGAFHYTASNDKTNKNSFVFFLDGYFQKKQNFSLGLSLAFSIYPKDAMAKNVIQINPYWSIYFGDKNSLMGRYLARLGYIYQRHSSVNYTLSKQYNVFSLNLKQYKGRFVNSFDFNYGDNANLVKDKAFTVYSLPEIHNYGFAISSRYIYSDIKNIAFSYIYEKFNDIDLQNQTYKKSIMNRFLISANFKL